MVANLIEVLVSGTMEEERNESKHEFNLFLDKEITKKLADVSEIVEDNDILCTVEFRGFKPKPAVNTKGNVNVQVDDFSTWVPDPNVKLRKPEKQNEGSSRVINNNLRSRRDSWRHDYKQKEIDYVFNHYTDVRQYVEQYRRGYTYHNFPPSRTPHGEQVGFVSLSRLPWTDNTVVNRPTLPPRISQQIINNSSPPPTPGHKLEHGQQNKESSSHMESNALQLPPSTNTKGSVAPQIASKANPNSANINNAHKGVNTNSKGPPSLLDLQHKYKIDPGAIKKFKEEGVDPPNEDSGRRSRKDSACQSRASSAKSAKETIQSRTGGNVNLTPGSSKVINGKESKGGHLAGIFHGKSMKQIPSNGFNIDVQP